MELQKQPLADQILVDLESKLDEIAVASSKNIKDHEARLQDLSDLLGKTSLDEILNNQQLRRKLIDFSFTDTGIDTIGNGLTSSNQMSRFFEACVENTLNTLSDKSQFQTRLTFFTVQMPASKYVLDFLEGTRLAVTKAVLSCDSDPTYTALSELKTSLDNFADRLDRPATHDEAVKEFKEKLNFFTQSKPGLLTINTLRGKWLTIGQIQKWLENRTRIEFLSKTQTDDISKLYIDIDDRMQKNPARQKSEIATILHDLIKNSVAEKNPKATCKNDTALYHIDLGSQLDFGKQNAMFPPETKNQTSVPLRPINDPLVNSTAVDHNNAKNIQNIQKGNSTVYVNTEDSTDELSQEYDKHYKQEEQLLCKLNQLEEEINRLSGYNAQIYTEKQSLEKYKKAITELEKTPKNPQSWFRWFLSLIGIKDVKAEQDATLRANNITSLRQNVTECENKIVEFTKQEYEWVKAISDKNDTENQIKILQQSMEKIQLAWVNAAESSSVVPNKASPKKMETDVGAPRRLR